MQAYLVLLYGIIMSFERRWLGGGFKAKIGKISRIWKNITYVAILILMYLTDLLFGAYNCKTIVFSL